MKDKKLLIKTLQFLAIIPMYYIIGTNNIFLYVLSLMLYNIFVSCFSHITIKENLPQIKNDSQKRKILNLTITSIGVISALFIILSIIVSDIINAILNLNHTFLVFLFMGISIITEPLTQILSEYIEITKSKKISKNLLNLYHILETILLLLTGLFIYKIFNISKNIAPALLYLPKIISAIIVSFLSYIILKKKKNNNKLQEEKTKINYKNELKRILTKNHCKSIIKIIKNSYYYISTIILYYVLTTRYGYATDDICQYLIFMYYYALTMINYITDVISILVKPKVKEKNVIKYIYSTFEIMLNITIIIYVTAPLICKLLFNDANQSTYLIMINFFTVFIALYNITFENIKKKKIIYINLILGILTKIILTLPLINSFYRMGYNLIYGDTLSTVISMFISIIINYIYIKTSNPQEKTLEKILKILYESILLCITLVLLQFIVPIKTNSYFKSILIFIVYIYISVIFIKLKNKIV